MMLIVVALNYLESTRSVVITAVGCLMVVGVHWNFMACVNNESQISLAQLNVVKFIS